MASSERRFGRAVIVGGSIAGIVSARVLSDHFEKVTVIERDPRPEGPESSRRGAPQARHAHVALEPVVRSLRRLFPGVIEQLDGAFCPDFASAMSWYHYGGWKPRFETDIETLLCTRAFLEWHVRQRVEALPDVEIRYEHVVEDLCADAGRGRVTGMRVKGAGGEEVLDADLVLDAAGRGSRAPRWLDALGYGRPEEEKVEFDLAYASRLYERPLDVGVDWRVLIVYSRPPGWRSGMVQEVEGGRWLVSLNGSFGDNPPADDEGFLAFARSLPVPELYEAIKDAKPIAAPAMHKVPSSRWFHYERMRRLPDSFLLLGDSVCVLNPIYGQGMTIALQSADALGESLASLRGAEDLRGLPRAFQRKLSGVVAPAWMLSTTMDLAFSEAKGRRPPGIGALQWMLLNLIDMTSQNERACRLFYEVLHMRRGPFSLAHPAMLLPLLSYSAKSLYTPLEARVNGTAMPRAPRRA